MKNDYRQINEPAKEKEKNEIAKGSKGHRTNDLPNKSIQHNKIAKKKNNNKNKNKQTKH